MKRPVILAERVAQGQQPAYVGTSDRSVTVDRVVNGQLCAGCGLCAGVSGGAIEMRMVDPGFMRPRQVGPVEAASERVIAASCPGAVVTPWASHPHVHPFWGPYREIFTGHATDADVRFQGSSGGVVTALAIHAIESGLVDRVIHIGPDPAEPTANVVVCSRTAAAVLANAGSRYATSSPLEAIDAVLAEGGRAAFIGKPCDVSALRALGQFDDRVGRHVPLKLSFFCAGAPARRGADRVLEAMDVERKDLAAFRYRGRGWPGRATATLRNGDTRSMSYDESWGGFLADEVQFRCKICPDAVGGSADVACADAWYGDADGYPNFDDRDGRSLVLTRTEAGAALVASATMSGRVVLQGLDAGQIDLMQPGQAQRKRMILARTLAMVLMRRPKPRMDGLRIKEAARRARISEATRNFLGTIRRIVIHRR